MRRLVVLLASAALAVLVASGAALAQASDEVDQENAAPGTGFYDAAGYSDEQGFHYSMLAQTFTVGKGGDLDAVELYLARPEPHSNYPVRITIYEVRSDGPGRILGDSVGGGSLQAEEVPSTGGWVRADIQARPYLELGKQYAITVRPWDDQDYRWAASGDTYPRGQGFSLAVDANAWEPTGGDFLFRTYMTPDLTPPSVVSTFPEAGSTDAHSYNGIQIEFSESIAKETVTASSIKVYRYARKAHRWRRVAVEFIGLDDPTVEEKYVFIDATPSDPNGGLRPTSRYKVVVTPDVEDLAGNQLDQNPDQRGQQPKVWKFTTTADV